MCTPLSLGWRTTSRRMSRRIGRSGRMGEGRGDAGVREIDGERTLAVGRWAELLLLGVKGKLSLLFPKSISDAWVLL